MYIGRILYILLILPFSIFGSQGKYPIQSFLPAEYKAGIQNIDFAQNRDMTIFVANNLGVLSYNGDKWEVHALESGKKQRSLAFDEKTNRLYVGSQGAFGYYTDNWDYVSFLEKIPQASKDFDEVWDVFISNAKVYFCTFQRIFVYDGEEIFVIEHPQGFNRSFHLEGKIFTQSQQGELFEIKGTSLIPHSSQNLKDQIIVGIIPQQEGYLLIYNSGKVVMSTSFGAVSKYQDLAKILNGKYINHVLQLSDTRIAISTQTAGLYLYDLQKQTIENISTSEGLQTNVCLRSFQDYSGNLWLGLQNGMALVDINSPMRFINQEINLQGNGYEAYEFDGHTYYTTSNGIYFLEKGKTQCVFLQGTAGPAYGMEKIMDKLYAGHHTGLFLLENGNATRIAETDGLWHVKQLQNNPNYAIGGTYSGLYLFKINEQRELQGIQAIEGFNESSRFFEEDQKGRIWVSQFYKGLYQLVLSESLKEASVNKISEASDIPSIKEQIILTKIDNALYLATRKGIYKINTYTDQIEKADFFAKDIGEQHVYLLMQDNQKNIHVYAKQLVGFFKQLSPNNYAFVPSSLFKLQYFFNNDLLHLSINLNNRVFFNANEGFIQYQPEMENRIFEKNPPLINKVYSASQHQNLLIRRPFDPKPNAIEELTISHKDKLLQFEVASFQFNDLNHHQFRYFLKGFDEEYSDWTNSTIKEYTNLKEGEYTFWVQAKNYLGETLSAQSLTLNVTPPFHRSLFAKLLYILLGILALFLFSHRQKRKFKLKAEEVENEKQIELSQKQQELIETERKKEQELLRLEEARIKSEIKHINNLLAASTMNLVVKNEFIETIKSKLQEVKRKGKNKETKLALEQIVKKIDITLKLQEDWEQFEYHFNKVHGDFLNRLREKFIDLTPNEQKLCTFLRLNLNTKDIANLMGISLRGVEVARYRLRKKLDLDKGQNLSKFILEY